MKTVWVVEDDPDIAAAYRAALETMGFAAALCASGEQAIAHVQTGPGVDAVILDLHLPGIGGEAVLRTIQSCWPETKVLVVTADHLLANMLATQPQVCEVLVKPVGLRALVELIRRYTGGSLNR